MRATKSMRKLVDCQVRHYNELLASDIDQGTKSHLCCMVENLLHSLDLYSGFNYNYWSERGCDEWYEAGQPEFPEKERYIIGLAGAGNKTIVGDDNENNKAKLRFTHKSQGEYSRHYFVRS